MIEVLLQEDKKKLLVNLIAVPVTGAATRPRYLNLDTKSYRQNLKKALGMGSNISILQSENKQEDLMIGYPEIHTLDIINIAIDMSLKSTEIIELLKLMRNEIKM